jgi:hypothetical protein
MRFKKTFRANNRRLNRPYTRSTVAGRRPRLPNHLNNALNALRRAVRSHRRLMALAPDQFDHSIIEHNETSREAAARDWEKWEPAFIKVYGDDARGSLERWQQAHSGRKSTPVSARRQRAIEAEVEQWQYALEAGNIHLTLFRKHHQWSRVTLSALARLFLIASDLGRLSTGIETNYKPPPSPVEPSISFEEALSRIYPADPDRGAPVV